MVKNAINRIYLFIIFLFLYAPIMVLIVFSFNNSKSRSHWNGFTLRWYIELFQDPVIKKALFYTIAIALLSSLIATIVGTIAAIGIHSFNDWKKTLILNINYIPILNPDIVTGVSLMILFIFARIKLGFWTMLLAHITFNIPYVMLSVLPKLKQLNSHLYEAALDLGATPLYAFLKSFFRKSGQVL